MSENGISLRDLARMWDVRDPMPDDLVEKVLVAIETEDLDTEYEAAITRSDRPSQAKRIYRHTGGGPVCRGSVAVRGRRSCMYATTLERGLLLWEL